MVKYLDINQPGYSIKCKVFCEAFREVEHVVLFAHGFGGHKDNKAAEKFADTALSKMKKTAVFVFDWPCHGKDVRKKLTLEDCDTYLSMVMPMGKLTDLPTFKEKVRMHPHNVNYGLLGYPVLMSADILLYKANFVPVGIDQAPHIEFAREMVRSFNYRFNTNVLVEPQMKVTPVPKVIGLDGVNKMSKSLDNHIEIALTEAETTKRIRTMVTDTNRKLKSDPGNPDICNVYSFHKMFSSRDEVEMVNTECRCAGIGCVDCKKRLAANLNENLAPFRAKREELAQKPDEIWEILHDGADRARKIARSTMEEVREAIGLAIC